MDEICNPLQENQEKKNCRTAQPILRDYSDKEKKELALLLLDAIEKDLTSRKPPSEEIFFHELHLIEEMAKDQPEILCKIASQLFRFGIHLQKGKIFLSALDKLMLVEEKDPIFFEKHREWVLLWGNIFISLSRSLKDLSFLQKAFQRFEIAEKQLKDNPVILKELYWSWGEAWVLLGKHSQEIGDFQKGIERYQLASQLGYALPHFRIDFGEAFLAYSHLNGNLESIQEALSLFKGAIADTYFPKQEPSAAYLKSWVMYALGAKKRYELTHAPEHLQEADTIFREAVTNVLMKAELWLYWGELYLISGWLNQNLDEIELALEKLTSCKIKECDPLKVSALLGQGLAMLGFLLEDFSMIKEGKHRIESALEVSPQHPKLLYAIGLIYLCEGMYLSDVTSYSKAVFIFEKNIEKNGADILSWQGLFQAYSGWAQALKDSSLMQKAIVAAARLSSLRPCSPYYLNEWGLLLLKKSEYVDPIQAEECLEEAIEKFKSAFNLRENLYPNNLKNWNFGCAKTPGLIDRKRPHISNIGSFTINQAREFSRQPKSNSSGCLGIETLYHWGCSLDLLSELTANVEDTLSAIEILTKVYEKKPHDPNVCFHLAKALLHYGELTSSLDHLQQSAELFYSILEKDFEYEEFCFSELGYCLLNQSVLIDEFIYPEKAQSLRNEAEKKLIRALELGNKESTYHLACLYSMCHLLQNSMDFLTKARKWDALPEIEDLEQDEWLSNVRDTPEFKEFLMLHKQK